MNAFGFSIAIFALFVAVSCGVPKDNYAVCSVEHGNVQEHQTVFDFENMVVVASDTRLPIVLINNTDAVGVISPFQLLIPNKKPTLASGSITWEAQGYSFIARSIPMNPRLYSVQAEPLVGPLAPDALPRRTTAMYSSDGSLMGFQRTIDGPVQMDTTVVVCGAKPIKLAELVAQRARTD
jgi:hypothetical protein